VGGPQTAVFVRGGLIESSILPNRELKIEHACWVIWPMGSMD